MQGRISLDPDGRSSPDRAAEMILDFYRSLDGMSPRLATDPSIFAYINHFYLHAYGLGRWGISDDDGQAERDVRNHWITRSGHFVDIYNRNTSGRAWWMAHTATMAAAASGGRFSASDALGKFIATSEYYNRTMQWEFLYNYKIMAECVHVLLDRDRMSIADYRRMLSNLNREAGGRILDSLDPGELGRLVARAAGGA